MSQNASEHINSQLNAAEKRQFSFKQTDRPGHWDRVHQIHRCTEQWCQRCKRRGRDWIHRELCSDACRRTNQ